MEDTNVFALITPDGTMTFEEGVPDRVWEKVDPHGDTEGFMVTHPDHATMRPGLRGYVGGSSALRREESQYNHRGSHMVMRLGGSRVYVELFGNVALCGYQPQPDGDVDVAGLTAEQQTQLADVHHELNQPVSSVEPHPYEDDWDDA